MPPGPCETVSCRPFMICVVENNKPKCICKKGYFEDPATGDCVSKSLSIRDTQSFRLDSKIMRGQMAEGLSHNVELYCATPGMQTLPCRAFLASVLDCIRRRYVLRGYKYFIFNTYYILQFFDIKNM